MHFVCMVPEYWFLYKNKCNCIIKSNNDPPAFSREGYYVFETIFQQLFTLLIY